MTPPLDPNFISPTGQRVAPAISAESRQDAAAFLAAQRLGMTAQEADQLVADMQARRREIHDLLQIGAGEPTGRERMAARTEKFAADVAQARAASMQATLPTAGTMREARGSAVHVKTKVAPEREIQADLV